MELEEILKPCLSVAKGTAGKVYRDGKGLVVKDMTGGNPDKVLREYDLQHAVYLRTPWVARPYRVVDRRFLLMEDLGERDRILDLGDAVRAAEELLVGLQSAGVRHNDFEPANVFVKDGMPYALDFGWAQWLIEDPTPVKRSDRDALFRSIAIWFLHPNG